MEKPYFEGWYFKHQKGDDMIAFIPGKADSGAFVQMIAPTGSRFFAMPELTHQDGCIQVGNCIFSSAGCKVDLPGVHGEITYAALTPLKSDIMGPFRFFPMECRHSIISMSHSLYGSLCLDGQMYHFDGGMGYIEKDSGTSFPRAYQWVQCSDFPFPCSIMVSIARIPFYGIRFRGCICAIVLDGKHYRFATYDGARILVSSKEHIRLAQGQSLLEIDLKPSPSGHLLYAPKLGQMSDTIRECCNAEIQVRLWEKGALILDASSQHSACEFVTPEK